MKKYQLLVIFALVFSAIGLATPASAQTDGGRGVSEHVPGNPSKPEPPPSKISDIQAILRERRSLAPSDPCAMSVTITVGQPITASLAADDCLVNNTFIDYYVFQGTAGQAISISETSSVFDTYLYLFDAASNVIDYNDDGANTSNSRIPVDGGVITLPYTGQYFIGANSYSRATGAYTVSVNTPAACAPKLAFYNQTPAGTLAASSCAINIAGQPFYTDLYTFYGAAGKQVSITLTSTAFDAYLTLHTPSGTGSLEDDDSGGGSNARIPASGTYTLPETGTYTIEASTFGQAQTGSYTLNITGPATGTISGRVVTPSGSGLRNATVSLTDSLGVRRTATTSSFGFYSFTDVPVGPDYVIRISSRQYRFTPQTLQFNDDLTNVNFTGLE